MAGHITLPSSSATTVYGPPSEGSIHSLQDAKIPTQYKPNSMTLWRFITAVVVTLAAITTFSLVLVSFNEDNASSDKNTEIIPARMLTSSPNVVTQTSVSPTSVLTLPRVAVTNLTLITATSEDNAKDACVKRKGIPTGVDWAVLVDNSSSFLCMQQSVAATKTSINDGQIDLSTLSVIRRLVVVSNTTMCPPKMRMVANPSSNLFVCMEFVSAKTAFDTQQYVVDVMTTSESFYNHNSPGWITWLSDVKLEAAASSSYLSVRYPVRPILALQIITDVTAATIYSACEKLVPRGEWESPGFVLKSPAGAVANTKSSDVLICIQRALANAKGPASVLTDLKAVLPTATCPKSSASVKSTEITSKYVKLCAQWGPVDFSKSGSDSPSSSASSSFVAELSQYEASKAESGQLNISTTVPGDWNVAGHVFTGTMQTFILTRKFEPFAFSSGENEFSSTVNGIASESGDKLSFKVLQVADMHITGNPDFECNDGPSKIRPAALAAASIIAEEMRAVSNSSSSARAGKTNDPLYYKCREALTIAFLDELLEIEKPDFVVFSGDNVETETNLKQDAFAINVFTARVERRKIPWAAVLGNHDEDGGLTREEMVSLMIKGKQFSHVKFGPRGIGGAGNYEVNIVAPRDGPWGKQGTAVFRMYFLDSLAYTNRLAFPLTNGNVYDWIQEPQIEFYRHLAKSHAAEVTTNGINSSKNGSVPAVMYYHIPLSENSLTSPLTRNGEQNQGVFGSTVNTGLFSALLEMGDVKATFVGHDHVNEYCYPRQGIQLCHAGGMGFGKAYGVTTFQRRVRVTEWTYDGNKGRTLRSWKRHFDDPTQIRSLEVLYSE